MSAEELALKQAERALTLWLEQREVALGDQQLDNKIQAYLSKAVVATETAVRRVTR